jgi:hypothetical protein
MSAVQTIAASPRLRAESLRGALLWLTGFSGAFVFIEPSPYEFVATIAGLLFLLLGMSVRPALAPLLLLLVLMNIGYAVAVVPVSDQSKPVTWVFVSEFLAATAIFYAAMVGTKRSGALLLLRWVSCIRVRCFACRPHPVIFCSAASPMCSSCTDGRAEPSTIPSCWRISGAAGDADAAARVGRKAVDVDVQRICAAGDARGAVSDVLARSMGAACPGRDGADGAHIHHQPFGA